MERKAIDGGERKFFQMPFLIEGGAHPLSPAEFLAVVSHACGAVQWALDERLGMLPGPVGAIIIMAG
jgi:hypothetical protein